MGKVIRFESRARGVCCPARNITFPALFRGVQSMSREDLDRFGLTDMEPFANYAYYTLRADEHLRRSGTMEFKQVRSITDLEHASLIVRWHRNEDRLSGYPDGIEDLTEDLFDEALTSEVCQTPDGLFTMVERLTRPQWPGPLVLSGAPQIFDRSEAHAAGGGVTAGETPAARRERGRPARILLRGSVSRCGGAAPPTSTLPCRPAVEPVRKAPARTLRE